VAVDYALDEWVHITLVHDGGMLRAYRNGVEVGSTPSGTTARPGGGEDSILQMGAIIPDDTENWSFAGELDEVRLWNIARSTSDVQQDMYVSLNGDEPGLVAYYMMSDGPPSMTLTDDTGNGWDGTLHDGNAFAPADGSPPEWITSTIPHDGSPTPTPTSTTTPGPTATNTPTPTPTGTPPTSTPTPTAQPTDAFIYLPLVNRH
jgi:cell division septation protein DedD